MTDPAVTGDFFAHLPRPMVLPAPEEIYDALMAQIEPELTTSQIPLLETKYGNENVDEAKARQQRYEKAYMAYDEKFRDYRREVEERSHTHQRAVMKATEERMSQSEGRRVTEIETQFSS